ncbi:RNA 3'-terminal phosphate cyclase [Candidatus Nanosalina sp. VS9-1]|uniref:RNA 3'-terminal phosphate cyclase n=1 Tax=Candidatus Nanosalina sp. VS9-1 TaxID=3388566 RepID=UPI0039DF872A
MIQINGEKGGGQMLRTALTLSAVTGKNFTIENIRGNRSNPGLKNQHLECVKAAKKLCDAKTEGLEKYSEKIVFKPGKYRNQDIESDIGTAGSTTLLFDTVLPVTTQFTEKFGIKASGGTDVKWSPTSLYYEHVKLLLLEKLGLETDFEVEKTGFYPKGGGKISLETENYSMESFELLERGELEKIEIYSKASRDLEESNVAERQADEAAKKLKKNFASEKVEKNFEYIESDSTGSALLIKAVYENSIAGFDALGEKGKSSEKVAEQAFQAFMEFHDSEASVDEYMADQLMVFAAIVDGVYSVPEINSHIRSNSYVIEKFGYRVEVGREESRAVLRAGK